MERVSHGGSMSSGLGHIDATRGWQTGREEFLRAACSGHHGAEKSVDKACFHGCLGMTLSWGLTSHKGLGHPQFHPVPLLDPVTVLVNKHLPGPHSKPHPPVMLTHPQQGLCVLNLTSQEYSGCCLLARVRKP